MIEFEIVKHVCYLSEKNESGWRKELNIVSWNGNKPKYDIREWSSDHKHMGKGITLDESEIKVLLNLKRLPSLEKSKKTTKKTESTRSLKSRAKKDAMKDMEGEEFFVHSANEKKLYLNSSPIVEYQGSGAHQAKKK